jgi:hypothetical protein
MLTYADVCGQVIADEESKNEFADLFVGLYPRMMNHLASTEGVLTCADVCSRMRTYPGVC